MHALVSLHHKPCDEPKREKFIDGKAERSAGKMNIWPATLYWGKERGEESHDG